MLSRANRILITFVIVALCLSALALGASAAGGPKSDAGSGAQLPQRSVPAARAPLASFTEDFEDITLLPAYGTELALSMLGRGVMKKALLGMVMAAVALLIASSAMTVSPGIVAKRVRSTSSTASRDFSR